MHCPDFIALGTYADVEIADADVEQFRDGVGLGSRPPSGDLLEDGRDARPRGELSNNVRRVGTQLRCLRVDPRGACVVRTRNGNLCQRFVLDVRPGVVHPAAAVE